VERKEKGRKGGGKEVKSGKVGRRGTERKQERRKKMKDGKMDTQAEKEWRR
jgi:hypothetical protein